MKKAFALAAVAAMTAASAAPALAGPYVGGKAVIKGTDEDYSKSELELRVGYGTKIGSLKPYIEVGPNWEMKDGVDEASTSKTLEIGTKIKMTDNLGGKIKAEYTLPDDGDADVDWKYEASIGYDF